MNEEIKEEETPKDEGVEEAETEEISFAFYSRGDFSIR